MPEPLELFAHLVAASAPEPVGQLVQEGMGEGVGAADGEGAREGAGEGLLLGHLLGGLLQWSAPVLFALRERIHPHQEWSNLGRF